MIKCIGFIGFGLIGGSLAKSLKKYNVTEKIIAYDVNKTSLNMAKSDGIIDEIASSIEDDFSDCDIIFLCCPVQVNIDMVKLLAPIIKTTCILTDVGSTKKDIHNMIENSGFAGHFIGGHPMTGSEKSGYTSSSAQLFENIYYILTPSKYTTNTDIKIMTKLIQSIDSIPLVMDPSVHDATTASISHVPHILAALIVNSVKDLDQGSGHMHTLAAGGFKDITRIASSSPIMWQQICLSNKEPIIFALKHYQSSLNNIINLVEDENSNDLYKLFEKARDYRSSFNNLQKGLLPTYYAFTVDVEDKPGIISTISTLLSESNINIKNIGIVNNREANSGVLSIQFSDASNMNASINLLKDIGYTLHL